MTLIFDRPKMTLIFDILGGGRPWSSVGVRGGPWSSVGVRGGPWSSVGDLLDRSLWLGKDILLNNQILNGLQWP
jgi:hypothetical protein